MRFGLVVGAAVAATVLASPSFAQDDAPPSWLFVLQGIVTEVADGRIALAPDPKTVAFTDRPARQIVLLETVEFIAAAWAEGGDFRALPPNASIVDEDAGTIGVVEIFNAVLSEGAVVFDFRSLIGFLPLAGDRVALTIDGSVCWVTTTDSATVTTTSTPCDDGDIGGQVQAGFDVGPTKTP
ncbi:MAG: hypothetical protein KIT43_13785 [Bauldia sp.]|nr:hypothetical protein [Bauldia sp.]